MQVPVVIGKGVSRPWHDLSKDGDCSLCSQKSHDMGIAEDLQLHQIFAYVRILRVTRKD